MTAQDHEAGKPRLLVVASTYPRWAGDHEPGFVHGLARGLLPFFDVLVICPHAPGAATSEVLDGVSVKRYRYAPAALETLVAGGGILPNLRRSRWKWLLVPGFLISQFMMLRRLCRTWRPAFVHAHWLVPQGLVAALAVPCARLPLLVTSHGTDIHSLRTPALLAIKRFVVRRAAAITVVSSAMLDEVARLGGLPGKSSVIPMGVDFGGYFAPDTSVQRSCDELLFVGRLTETKGLRHLIAAMPSVLAVRPATSLTVVGYGPQLEEFRMQAASLGIAHKVRFEGALPQAALPGLYRRAAALVAPFEQAPSGAKEGLGLVMIEAIGCGCPVVTTRQPATVDVFGETGPAGLAAPGDPQALASEILRVLDDARAAHAETMSVRRSVVDRFGIDVVARRYAQLLLAIMDARTSEPGASEPRA